MTVQAYKLGSLGQDNLSGIKLISDIELKEIDPDERK